MSEFKVGDKAVVGPDAWYREIRGREVTIAAVTSSGVWFDDPLGNWTAGVCESPDLMLRQEQQDAPSADEWEAAAVKALAAFDPNRKVASISFTQKGPWTMAAVETPQNTAFIPPRKGVGFARCKDTDRNIPAFGKLLALGRAMKDLG